MPGTPQDGGTLPRSPAPLLPPSQTKDQGAKDDGLVYDPMILFGWWCPVYGFTREQAGDSDCHAIHAPLYRRVTEGGQ